MLIFHFTNFNKSNWIYSTFYRRDTFMLLLEPLSFITSYWLLRFLYFCFIVKKVAIRKRLKFYDHSLSIAVYDTIVISDKKGKFIYQRNIPLKHSMPQMILNTCIEILTLNGGKIIRDPRVKFTIFYGIRSINMLEAETRQLVRSIALWAFTPLRLSRLTWPRNATRTTIISISIPTNRYSQSRSTMGSPYFLSPHPTQEWICIYCR